jgi:hypothetical protein
VPILKAAAVRQAVSKKILESASKLSNTIAAKKIPIVVDFESFIDTWTFLGLPDSTREDLLHKSIYFFLMLWPPSPSFLPPSSSFLFLPSSSVPLTRSSPQHPRGSLGGDVRESL